MKETVRTLVNVRLFRVQPLRKLLVRVSLNRQRLSDGEDLYVENGEPNLLEVDRKKRTLKRNGKSSPNFLTTLSPSNSGCALRCSFRSLPSLRRVEGQEGCVPIQSCGNEVNIECIGEE